jgi:hypothetical protein
VKFRNPIFSKKSDFSVLPNPCFMIERRFFGDNWLCDALFWFVDGAVVAVAPLGRLCGEWFADCVGSGSSVGVAIG